MSDTDTTQPDFAFFECSECHYTAVEPAGTERAACTYCWAEHGNITAMTRTACRTTDRPEGFDARQQKRSA